MSLQLLSPHGLPKMFSISDSINSKSVPEFKSSHFAPVLETASESTDISVELADSFFFFLAYSSVAPESTARWLTSCQIQSLPSWLTPCWLCQPNLLLPGWCLTALIYSLVASFPALQSPDFPPLPLQGLTNVSGKQCCA